jgi:hypothetical protein
MLRVDAPSALGGWSYQVADTKLARETRAGTILQLGLYSELGGGCGRGGAACAATTRSATSCVGFMGRGHDSRGLF